MKLLDFSLSCAAPIHEYESVRASAIPLAHGAGEAHVYSVRIEAGGSIGLHQAGFGQLFLVLEGGGWVEGADGHRLSVVAGRGVFIPRGEHHAKGSDTGMTALMIQVANLAPDPAAG